MQKNSRYTVLTTISKGKGKRKAVPLQAWSGPEGSRKLRFSDLMTTAQDGGKFVSSTHRPPLPLRKYSWYSFLWGERGGIVVKALRYKPEGRGFDSP